MLNLRRIKHVKQIVVDNNNYFTIYDGGQRVETQYLKTHFSEFDALQKHYKTKLLFEYQSLKHYENFKAHVIRYYNIFDDKVYAFCKIKGHELYFFIPKETAKYWMKHPVTL